MLRQLSLFSALPYDRHGAKNPRWKGGRRTRKDGYVLVYAPGHPYACKDFVLEHRLVMERHLGRYLKPEELVHHKNEDKSDNRLENLELTDSVEHARHHFTGRTYERWKPRVSRETLSEWYMIERLTIRQCGHRLGISYGAAREHFERFGITRRGPSITTSLTRQRKRWAASQGEDSPMSKLTADSVRTIRQLAREKISQSQIAAQFGVCQHTVWAILRGVTWRHVAR